MTQEEIVSSTKTVSQGLEALRSEHQSILQGLQGSLKAANQEKLDANVIEEKAGLIKKSLDMIELGLGEAQVSYCSPVSFFSSSCDCNLIPPFVTYPIGYGSSGDALASA